MLADPSGTFAFLAVLLVAWGVTEVGLSVYDAYSTGETLLDPCVSGGGKLFAGGMFVAGGLLPGGGYSAGDDVIDGGRNVFVSEKGIRRVEQHLSGLPGNALIEPENQAMVARLGAALDEGRPVIGADANFYLHELSESTFMTKHGMLYDDAHEAALVKYGISRFGVYHPDVIRANPRSFSQPWKDYWGIK